MGSFSLMHWLVVLAIILVLFGAGRIPQVMGDFAKGLKAFKSGMKEGEEAEAPRSAPPLDHSKTAASVGVEQPRERV